MNNVFSFFTRRKSSSKDEDGPRSPSPIPNIVVDKEKEQEMKLKQPPSTSSSDTFNCVKLTESPNEKRCSIEYLVKEIYTWFFQCNAFLLCNTICRLKNTT